MAPLASAKSHKKKHKAKVVGAFYTQTNDLAANSIIKFKRYNDGRLKKAQTVQTGGKGSTQTVGCGPNCPILDSDGAVDMTPNGKLVFTVNAGSNTITSLRETPTGLKKADTQPSNGQLPESITAFGGVVYVLNVNSNNISGFKYSSTGKLTPIPNSTVPLAAPTQTARQIGFDNSGKVLVVSDLGAGQLDSFTLKSDGSPNPATPHASQTPLPFGFAFDPSNRLLVTELTVPPPPMGPGGNGSLSSYQVAAGGNITPIDSKSTNDQLPCWVAITGNGKYAFAVNTGAGAQASVARFRVAADGHLTHLGNANRPEFALTDIALSRGSKFAYVLAPTVTGSSKSHIVEYKVGKSGKLTYVRHTPSNLPTGVTGLDGR